MNIVKATLYFVFLEFVTIFSWFALVVHIKDIINFMVTDTASIAPQAVGIGQNVVTAINVLFIILVVVWVCWYAYIAHALTYETSYQVLDGYRRF